MTLFDHVAERFARETDRAMEKNGYTRGKLILEAAERIIPAGAHVLDYGCGPGRLSLLLARSGYRVLGVDISEGMIAQACTLDGHGLNLEFRKIENPGEILLPNSCDAIVCSSVIEYVLDPDQLLKEFHRALRRPGALIISYANRSSLWRRYWDRDTPQPNPMYTPHNKVWNWRGFRTLLARNGFRSMIGPRFFDSPCDWQPWGRFLRSFSLVGSLGLVVARPGPIDPPG